MKQEIGENHNPKSRSPTQNLEGDCRIPYITALQVVPVFTKGQIQMLYMANLIPRMLELYI